MSLTLYLVNNSELFPNLHLKINLIYRSIFCTVKTNSNRSYIVILLYLFLYLYFYNVITIYDSMADISNNYYNNKPLWNNKLQESLNSLCIISNYIRVLLKKSNQPYPIVIYHMTFDSKVDVIVFLCHNYITESGKEPFTPSWRTGVGICVGESWRNLNSEIL